MRCMVITACLWTGAALGCADEPMEALPPVVEATTESAPVSVDYTEWSADQTGTTAKPAYGKGCRYRAGAESVWELAADGPDDSFRLSGDAAGEVSATFEVMASGARVLSATATLERVLSGKSYYAAKGTLTMDGESWTLLDGTLCFEASVVTSTSDLAAEFSLIASRDGDGLLRTVGGTFTLASDKMATGTDLDIADEAIALDLR